MPDSKDRVQRIDVPAGVGETWTLRIDERTRRRSGLRLRFTTAAGTVVTVPIAAGGDVLIAPGPDLQRCRIELELTALDDSGGVRIVE